MAFPSCLGFTRRCNPLPRLSQPALLPHTSLTQSQLRSPQRWQQHAAGEPVRNPVDMAGTPFAELGLQDLMEGMGRVRVRQHVNPLRCEFQSPTAPPDWGSIYSDPSKPLFVDLGCGPGRFLLLLRRRHEEQQAAAAAAAAEAHQQAQQQQQQRQGQPPYNYLGLEIRRQLVDRANKWAESLGYQREVAFIFTNATVSLASLLSTYPGPLARVAVQFPDPHFKKRHKKRRILQPGVVTEVRRLLVPGGEVFLQSDVWEAASAMRDAFEQTAADAFDLAPQHHQEGSVFQWSEQDEREAQAAAAAEGTGPSRSSGSSTSSGGNEESSSSDSSEGELGDREEEEEDSFVSQWAAGGWLQHNPIGTPTEREHYVQQQGGKVFRVLLVRNGKE